MNRNNVLLLMLGLIILVLVGCSSQSGSLMGTSQGSGELAVFIADKPVNNVKNVYVTIEEVQVKKEDSSWETINDFENEGGKKQFDLLQLRFNELMLGQKTLPAGKYTQMRLIVAAQKENYGGGKNKSSQSYIIDNDNKVHKLFIPSGPQTGLKIPCNFLIEEGIITQLTLDVNVAEVLHSAGNSGKIILNPVKAIQIIDRVKSGNIEGRVFVDVNDNNTFDEDGDGQPDEVLSTEDETIADDNFDVIVEALDNGEIVKNTVATAKDITTEGKIKPAGSFFLRGLEEGNYTIRAKVVDGEGNVVSNYINDEKTVEVINGETVTVDNLFINQNQIQ